MRRSAHGALVAMLVSPAILLAASSPAIANDDTREPVVAAWTAAASSGASGPRALAAQTTALDAAQFAAAMTTTLTSAADGSRYLGPALSGLVIDPVDGTVIWRHLDGRSRLPASTQKLLTAFTVLRSMKPDAVLTTRVYQSTADRGRIYLRGGGDPSLGAARIGALAEATARRLALQKRTSVVLYVDRSIFPAPTMAPGWKASYRSDVQPPQGLTLAGYRKPDGALAAGRAFVAALKARGVTAKLSTITTTPATRTELATTASAPISRLVASMLNASINDYAEFLLRHAAQAGGKPATWQGAAQHEVAVLRAARIPLGGVRIIDGTGLSRLARMTPATLAGVVRLMWNTPADKAIVFSPNGIPRAGQTGTLATRYRITAHRCAQGLVLAKTGTLDDAVALAGVAQGADGRDRVFAFVENGIVGKNTSVRLALDTLATTVVGCRLG